MKTVSMLEFRQHADEVIRRVGRGQRLVLTHRGRPVMRLEPYQEGQTPDDDPFYALAELSDAAGENLTNDEMDRIVYGE